VNISSWLRKPENGFRLSDTFGEGAVAEGRFAEPPDAARRS